MYESLYLPSWRLMDQPPTDQPIQPTQPTQPQALHELRKGLCRAALVRARERMQLEYIPQVGASN